MYLKPEWAAKEGIDKSFTNSGNDIPTEIAIANAYVVPAGKELRVVQGAFMAYGSVAATRDLNQMCFLRITRVRAGVTTDPFFQGGNGGGPMHLPEPLVFIAADAVTFAEYNGANHDCDLGFYIGAYEVTV